jgi:hypothetical protein
MNGQDSRPNPVANWPSILLAFAVAGNLLWIQKPLKSFRPAETLTAEHPTMGRQDVDAMLWQDPYEALFTHRLNSARAGAAHDEYRLQGGLASLISELNRPGGNLIVLPVVVTGSPYQEGKEWRITARYAVISALGSCGYLPEDREHVGFFSIPWHTKAGIQGELKQSSGNQKEVKVEGEGRIDIPYELFTLGDPAGGNDGPDGKKCVLVLWLMEEPFSDYPLYRLNYLFKDLRQGWKGGLSFDLIGPLSSDTLMAMVNELSNGKKSLDLNDLTIFSPYATAADFLIDDKDNRGPAICSACINPRASIKTRFEESGIRFVNLTCTDDQLVVELIDELARRGVDLDRGNDKVVLVCEWDTSYGRAWPKTIKKVLDLRRSLLGIHPGESMDHQFLVRTYLRGVDGMVIQKDSPKSIMEASDDSKGEEINQVTDKMERPEGTGQKDYIQRLGNHLAFLESKNGRIRAIGIFSGDVYDKLLLLQSLRQRFGEALFFTSDFDTRISHSSQLDWTRNLIVASSFGLSLRDDLQRGIPPFRSSYQTATFFAVLNALEGPIKDLALRPKVFEIGRTTGVDLTVPPAIDSSGKNLERLHHSPADDAWAQAKMPTQHPFIERVVPWSDILLVLASISAFMVMLGWFFRPVRDYFMEKVKSLVLLKAGNWLSFVWCWSTLLGTLAFVFLIVSSHGSPDGEPVFLMEGVSIWPSTVARFVALCLSVIFLQRCWKNLVKNEKEIFTAIMNNPERKNTEERISGLRRWLRLALLHRAEASISKWRSECSDVSDGHPVSMEWIWNKYTRLGSLWMRSTRFVPITMLYFSIGIIIFCLFGIPFRPFRGELSGIVDQVVLSLTVIAQVLLTFFVVDITHLSSCLIKHVAAPTVWNEETLKKWSDTKGIPPDYLDEWLDVKFIAAHTHVVARFIYYPFIVLLIMILARFSLFDRFPWTWPLVIVFTLNLTFALYCAALLHTTAAEAKAKSLSFLGDKLCCLWKDKDKSGKGQMVHGGLIKQIEHLIHEIEVNRQGAFVPLWENPVLRAFLMPFGGVGVLAMVEYFTRM